MPRSARHKTDQSSAELVWQLSGVVVELGVVVEHTDQDALLGNAISAIPVLGSLDSHLWQSCNPRQNISPQAC